MSERKPFTELTVLEKLQWLNDTRNIGRFRCEDPADDQDLSTIIGQCLVQLKGSEIWECKNCHRCKGSGCVACDGRGYITNPVYPNSDNDLLPGEVLINGSEVEFQLKVKEEDLEKEARKIYAQSVVDYGKEDCYYSFTKFLWVKFPDGRQEERLDSIVEYE